MQFVFSLYKRKHLFSIVSSVVLVSSPSIRVLVGSWPSTCPNQQTWTHQRRRKVDWTQLSYVVEKQIHCMVLENQGFHGSTGSVRGNRSWWLKWKWWEKWESWTTHGQGRTCSHKSGNARGYVADSGRKEDFQRGLV